MRRWRDGLFCEFGKLNPHITPEEAVAAAVFINCLVLLIVFARLPDGVPLDPRMPVGRLVHFASRRA